MLCNRPWVTWWWNNQVPTSGTASSTFWIKGPHTQAANLCCDSEDCPVPPTSLMSEWQQPQEGDFTEEKKKKKSTLGAYQDTLRVTQCVHQTQPIESIPETSSTSTKKNKSKTPSFCQITHFQSPDSPHIPDHHPIWELDAQRLWVSSGVLCAPENHFPANLTYENGRPTLSKNYSQLFPLYTFKNTEWDKPGSPLQKLKGHLSSKAPQEKRGALPGDSRAGGQEQERRETGAGGRLPAPAGPPVCWNVSPPGAASQVPALNRGAWSPQAGRFFPPIVLPTR